MIVIGGGVAVFFMMNSGPEFTCSMAKASSERAAETQRRIASANEFEKEGLKAQYEKEKRTAAVDTQQCEEMKTQQRAFSILGGVVAALGFFFTLGGIGAIILGFRKKTV
jgi:hypothetical protein